MTIKNLTPAYVTALGGVALSCGWIAVNNDSLKADGPPDCSCLIGSYPGCMAISCTPNTITCDQGGLNCTTTMNGLSS